MWSDLDQRNGWMLLGTTVLRTLLLLLFDFLLFFFLGGHDI